MTIRTIRVFLAGITVALAVWAQTPAPQTSPAAPAQGSRRSGGVVQGSVKDDTGGVIPGAVVTLTNAGGATQTVNTGADGSYTFRGVAPGTYTVSATYAGLQQQGAVAVSVQGGQPATGNVVMTVAEQKQEVTVTESTANQVSVEASNNSSQLVLKAEDLDALPDDPDDLEADLQALAGPSAGPGGSQIYIDGFTGGRLPPKESIREIRINSNPFSAEFDKLGYGRIQIFTKPGSDKFHGQGQFNFSDGVWNSRNPFLSVNPPFRTEQFGGNVSGPITKHSSFFVDVERRNIDDNGIVTATIPTATFLGSSSYQTFYSTPQRRTTVSPRVDYQLGANNTLSFRYSYLDNEHILSHIGAFNLPQTTVGNLTYPSNGYSQSSTENSVQMVETAVLNTHVVNETHFQFDRTYQSTTSSSTTPQLNVGQSFIAGGSGYSTSLYPKSYDLDTGYEMQNYTSVTWGPHTTKFGIRIRATTIDDSTPSGFNGTYSFLGGTISPISVLGVGGGTVSSIQQYLYTERLLALGYTSTQVSAFGLGPSKFTLTSGNPYINLSQIDFGPFVQDDWRVKPNFTLSLGLRWESQTNIGDKNDWAPRVGFAWSPGSNGKGSGRAKTVIRGGFGYFFDRFAVTNVLTAYRYGFGGSQVQYTVDNPTDYTATFSTTPSLASATIANAQQRYQIDNALKAPRIAQIVLGVDRQLNSHTTLSLNLMNARGTHELRTVDINAPIPTTGAYPPGTSTAAGGSRSNANSNSVGVRPYGNVGDIYDYQSTGIFKQTLAIANINTQIGRGVTLFGRYSYTQAHSDTDGLGTLPSNPYNLHQDWGRSSLGTHHNVFIGGSMRTYWGVRLSPFIVMHSGGFYNITTGTDLYLQGNNAPTARPQSVSSSFPGAVLTPYGYLNPYPLVGAPVIERNIATGPGFIGINLRVSKTWGFGPTKFAGQSGGAHAGGGGGHGGGGPRGGGGGFGGGPGGGGPGGPPGESTEHRFNLTFSANARNILNHENLNTPNGAMTSPYFLQSTGITGGFGAEATASNQRRMDLSLRFAF